jgi:hypothetical protein
MKTWARWGGVSYGADRRLLMTQPGSVRMPRPTIRFMESADRGRGSYFCAIP